MDVTRMDGMSVSGGGGGGWDGGTRNGSRCAVGSAFGLLIGLLVSCANPQAPSGGPRDSTPPSVVQTRPVQDTVNVSTDVGALRVEFSEYVERSTLSQALSITPTFEQRPQFSWDGRAVEIQFPSALRDSTTYIFTFGTTLSDARGVSLETPITVAFSTGERINRGQIEGRVVNGPSGTTQQGRGCICLRPPARGVGRPAAARRAQLSHTDRRGGALFVRLHAGRALLCSCPPRQQPQS
ncbi:Ig-like domain-containing protein, partial [Salinibacter ruber]|uniref:Ig-like domain-containing protein n=1 Tax=Salinibacter ruber TaxID=146919 RepID=UPI00311AAD3E